MLIQQNSNIQRSNLLLCTQMILISYPWFFITTTAHPIWQLSFSYKRLENQTLSNANVYSFIIHVYSFCLFNPQQRYCLFILSSVLIRLQPSTDSGKLQFSKSSKIQNHSEILQTSSTKMGKIHWQLVPKQLVFLKLKSFTSWDWKEIRRYDNGESIKHRSVGTVT